LKISDWQYIKDEGGGEGGYTQSHDNIASQFALKECVHTPKSISPRIFSSPARKNCEHPGKKKNK
jgi:hypothetical protein